MKLTPEQQDAARAILQSNDESFLHLLRLAGLDPAQVLPGADLRGVVFTQNDDVTGLDFRRCDLRGTDLTQAIGVDQALFTDVISDATTKGLPPARRPVDFAEDKARDMILRGVPPPRSWVPFITELNLASHKDFRDLTPLAGLSKLAWLSLDRTAVTDLTPLADLSALRWLHLTGTGVTDLTPLTGLSALQVLDLVDTPVTELGRVDGFDQDKHTSQSHE